jgi:hypothetical protein
MDSNYLLSKNHFVAYNQIVQDYSTIVMFENELINLKNFKNSKAIKKIESEIVLLLTRVIENKKILNFTYDLDMVHLQSM